MTGEINRSSGPWPNVAIHQRSRMTPSAPAPTSNRTIGDGAIRRSNSDGFESAGIYLAAPASAG